MILIEFLMKHQYGNQDKIEKAEKSGKQAEQDVCKGREKKNKKKNENKN